MSLATLVADVVVERGGGGMTWDFLHIMIALLIILGVIAIVVIVTRAMGWTIPQWVIQILVVCAVVALGIIAIRFLWTLF